MQINEQLKNAILYEINENGIVGLVDTIIAALVENVNLQEDIDLNWQVAILQDRINFVHQKVNATHEN